MNQPKRPMAAVAAVAAALLGAACSSSSPGGSTSGGQTSAGASSAGAGTTAGTTGTTGNDGTTGTTGGTTAASSAASSTGAVSSGTTGGASTGGGTTGTTGASNDGGKQVSLGQACFTFSEAISALSSQGQACSLMLAHSESFQACEAEFAACNSDDYPLIQNVGSCLEVLACDPQNPDNLTGGIAQCAKIFDAASGPCQAAANDYDAGY